ncbi:MAG: hypothetical protein ACE5JG_11325, partial [Planctomycetota bacterium]
MRVAILAVLGTGFLFTALVAQDEPVQLELQIYDVGALTQEYEDVPLQSFGPGGPSGYAPPEVEESDDAQVASVDLLVETIRMLIEPQSWDSLRGANIEARPNALAVWTTPEIQGRITRLLDWLTATLAARIRLEAHWLAFSKQSAERLAASGLLAALARGDLDRRQVAALLDEAVLEGNEHESGSTSAYAGQRVAVRKTTAVAFLKDLDVEIAEGSQIAQPVTETGTEGLRVDVRPFPLAGSDGVGLSVLGRAGRFAQPMPTFELEADELGKVDLPEFGSVTFSGGGAVASGHSLALVARRPQGAGGPALGVLLVTAHRDPPPAPLSSFSHTPVGLLTARGAGDQYGVGWPRGLDQNMRDRLSPKLVLIPEVGHHFGTVDELMELVRSSVGAPEAWEQEPAFISAHNDGLFVRQTPEMQ